MIAIDTNVLVYAFDASEPLKQPQAQLLLAKLLERTDVLLPWQVACEFLNCLRKWERSGRIARAELEAYIANLLRMFPVTLPKVELLNTAIDLSSRHSLSHWDSLLLAACVDAGITTLYSEDFSAGCTYDSVSIVNPFVTNTL